MGKIVNFNSENIEIMNYENINDELMRCKIRVMYSGLNYNGFNIDKAVIEKALDTIYYIPIVGEVVEYENGISFGDHAITQEEDGSFVCNTIPFGVVAGKEDNCIEWEEVDGKEYLTCIGYLWRRYDLVEKFESQDFYQSMEIAINKSRKKRGKNIVDILDFNFSALCILNKDLDNMENSVAPCFEGANIERFQKNKFNAEIDELIKTIESFSAKKGDVMVDKDQTLITEDVNAFAKEEDEKKGCFVEEPKKEEEAIETPETEITEETKDAPEVIEETEKVEEEVAPEIEETVVEEIEDAKEEVVEEVVEEVKEEEEEEVNATFSLSLDEKLTQIRQELAKKTIEVEYCWGEKYIENEFYFETLFEVEGMGDVVVVNSNDFSCKYFIPYKLNGDAVILDFENKVKCVTTYRPFESGEAVEMANEKIQVMTANFEKYTNNLQSSLKELKEFRRQVEFAKRQDEVETTIAKFSFADEEIAEFKDKAINGEMTIDTLELHLFALAGKKAMALKVEEENSEIVKFSKNNINKVNVNPYGNLIR